MREINIEHLKRPLIADYSNLLSQLIIYSIECVYW